MKSNRLLKVLIGGMIASFILVLSFVFIGVYAAETSETAEAETGIKTAIDFIRSMSADDLKGWLAGAIAYFSANIVTFVGIGIAFIRAKVKNYQTDEKYKEIIAKLDADHQAKVEALIESFNAKLDNAQSSINSTIESLDEKKKSEAKANIEVLKQSLDEIKVDLEK